MSSEDITNQTYDRIAADFADRFWHIILEQALDTFVTAVQGTKPVLDAGCGPGRDIMLLRERGLNVIGMDLSLGMLREAQQRAGGALVRGNLRVIPLAPATLSGIWMCASLLHIPRAQVPDVLAEARRILEPGGVLYISVQQGDGERWSDSDGGQRFFTLFQPDDLHALVAKAGLTLEKHWIQPGGHSQWLQVIARNPA